MQLWSKLRKSVVGGLAHRPRHLAAQTQATNSNLLIEEFATVELGSAEDLFTPVVENSKTIINSLQDVVTEDSRSCGRLK